MDFQRFGIDARLAKAAESLPTSFFYYEKMLAHAVELQENVCVKITLDAGREEVLLLPALQWLVSGEEGRKLLVIVPDSGSADRCAAAVDNLGASAGLGSCVLSRETASGIAEASSEDGASPQSTILSKGDPAARVLIGMAVDLLEASGVNLRDYGFLVVDGMERLSEVPDLVRKLTASLLPSWERRSALACSKFSVKVKNLAWDLADNPSEISIEGEVAKAQSVLKETWKVPVESKLVFLLGLISREKPARLCVFCNLKDTATDLTRRLSGNGIPSDTILGPLSPERKFALIEKFRAGDSICLALSDEGADGLTPGVFPLVVNYDIPLEPELFVKRLEMLDRSDPSAKVVSIACDRYIFGLPAVEQYIDARLEAVPADESMLTSVDRSDVRGSERKRDAGPREPRPSQPQRRGPPHRREDGRRDGLPRDAYPREGRNNPDIRKSISEATGGALDMGGALPMDRGVPRPGANEPRRGQRPSGGGNTGGAKNGRRDSPRDDAHRNDANRDGANRDGARREDPRRGARPPAKRGQQVRPSPNRPLPGARPAAGGPKPHGNPYDLPMEERMKLYREKYGRSLDENAARNGQRKKPGPGSKSGQSGANDNQHPPVQRKPSDRDQPIGRGRKNDNSRNSPKEHNGRQAPATSPINGQVPQMEPEKKPEGFIGRILGGLRKKKE